MIRDASGLFAMAGVVMATGILAALQPGVDLHHQFYALGDFRLESGTSSRRRASSTAPTAG